MARHANTGRGLARARKRRTEGGLFHKVGSALSKGLGKVAQAMSTAEDLDAIDLLKAQHRAIDRLFREVQSASGTSKATSFRELADLLATHATIEEWIFYPGVRSAETEDLLAESREEHLAIKRTAGRHARRGRGRGNLRRQAQRARGAGAPSRDRGRRSEALPHGARRGRRRLSGGPRRRDDRADGGGAGKGRAAKRRPAPRPTKQRPSKSNVSRTTATRPLGGSEPRIPTRAPLRSSGRRSEG